MGRKKYIFTEIGFNQKDGNIRQNVTIAEYMLLYTVPRKKHTKIGRIWYLEQKKVLQIGYCSNRKIATRAKNAQDQKYI